MKLAFIHVSLCAIVFLAWNNCHGAETKSPDFKHDIVPILSRCSSCHGIEVKEGGLNLMRRQAALDGGESGRAIVPGKSSESLLIKLVSGADKDRQMPPPDEGKSLTPAQIDTLKRWIDAGADWPASADGTNHWAYQPIKRPLALAVKNSAWIKSPLDAFVLARLEKKASRPIPRPNARRGCDVCRST